MTNEQQERHKRFDEVFPYLTEIKVTPNKDSDFEKVQILQVMYDRISKDLKSFLDEEVSLAVTNKEKEILEMIDKQDWECFEQTFIKKDIINLISKIK